MNKTQTKYSNNRLHISDKPKKTGTWWVAHIVGLNDFEHIHVSDDTNLSRGDLVIITTRFGLDMAKICGQITDIESIDATQIRRIIRPAQEADLIQKEKLKKKENDAFNLCQKYITEKRLPMQLITTHYMLNEERLLFLYTAEKRIDFRNLVKDMASSFMTRIEMRHMGVRDGSRICGGLSICGRIFCCHNVMKRIAPVSINMAKDQNLSLNTNKLTGACGRLMCCLAFEQQHYSDFRKAAPREGEQVVSGNTRYTVTEINALKGCIRLTARKGEHTQVPPTQLIRKDKGEWILNEKEINQS